MNPLLYNYEHQSKTNSTLGNKLIKSVDSPLADNVIIIQCPYLLFFLIKQHKKLGK